MSARGAGKPSGLRDLLTRRMLVGRFEGAQERLVLQASDLSLETVAAMVETGAIDVKPQFQRRDRWPPSKQSALIESFLLNVPVPPVYLAEDEYGVYSVIDGKQRLTAIRDFMKAGMALVGLASIEELNGASFEDLPPELANALTVRPYIRAVTLLKQSDPDLRYEVFTRLNTGGEPLNAQEIRNVAFRGPLNELIYALSEAPFLRRQLKITNNRSPAYRNMTDAEFVLRFFTLLETWSDFSGDLRDSMDGYMKNHQNASEEQLAQLATIFDRALGWSSRLWGNEAFRRPAGDSWRDQTLAGMYDAQMVSVALLGDDVLTVAAEKPSEIKRDIRSLFSNREFDEAVRQGTNTPSRIRFRIQALRNSLSRIAGV